MSQPTSPSLAPVTENITPKRNKTPELVCIVLGTKRLTNRKYLEEKAQANNISISDYLGLFISRPALKLLRLGKTVAEVRTALQSTVAAPISDETLQKAIKVNGKHKKA